MVTEREAFESWWVQQDTAGLSDSCRWSAWNAWLAACAWQREQILVMLPGGYSVDPQWLADEIRAQGER